MDFIYNSSKISFYKIMKEYGLIKLGYNRKRKKLQLKYDEVLRNFDTIAYEKLLYQRKNLDIKYIKKVIKIFKPILKDNITVFLHGSYARNLNRWHSDIDLNILYRNEFRDEYLMLEEFILVLLYKLLCFDGRDKIHNVMIYYPLYDDINYEIEGNKHRMIYNKNVVNFCMNYEEMYPKYLNSTRDVNDLYKGVMEIDGYKEYSYSFEGMNRKGKKFIKKVLKDKDILFKQEKVKYFDDKKLIDISDVKLEVEISLLKKRLKLNNMDAINGFLLNLRKFIILKGENCLNLDSKRILHHRELRKYFFKQELREIEYNITKYRMVLDRVENLFWKLKINYSSREYSIITIDKLNKEYYKLYKTSLNKDLEVIITLNKIIYHVSKYLKFSSLK